MQWKESHPGFLGFVFALAVCTSYGDPLRPPAVATVAQTVGELTSEMRQEAVDFEKYTHHMGSPFGRRLRDHCAQQAGYSFFCGSILKGPEWEAQATLQKRKNRKHRVRAANIRVSHNQIANLEKLRREDLGKLLKGLHKLTDAQLTLARREASSQAGLGCPQNWALAVAIEAEDLLPDDIAPLELADLYRQGAECPAAAPIDREAEWSRAGLFYFWAAQYRQAALCFQKATETKDVYVGRALFWLWRTQLKLRLAEPAHQTLQTLLERYPFAFHTLVAATLEKKDAGSILNQRPLASVLYRSLDAPQINHLLDEVERLKAAHCSYGASKLLDWILVQSQEIEPEVKMYLAQLKDDSGDPAGKISILSDVLYHNPNLVSRDSMEFYFPRLYFPLFERNAGALDPYLLLAIARQESAFNPSAVSHANARGLLQIKRSGSRRWQRKLLDPEVNVRLGATHIQRLLTQLNNQVPLSLAAYNAGEHKLALWLERYPVDSPMLFLDLIPYRETRDYVSTILRNYFWYRRLNTQSTDSTLSALFGSLHPEH